MFLRQCFVAVGYKGFGNAGMLLGGWSDLFNCFAQCRYELLKIFVINANDEAGVGAELAGAEGNGTGIQFSQVSRRLL